MPPIASSWSGRAGRRFGGLRRGQTTIDVWLCCGLGWRQLPGTNPEGCAARCLVDHVLENPSGGPVWVCGVRRRLPAGLPSRSDAALKWRFGLAGEPGATCRQFRVGGGERCRVPLCAVSAWRPCPAWRGKGAHAECSGGMPQARGVGADRIRCTCMCTEFILYLFWTQRCMHLMGGQVLGFAGGCGPAFFYCTQPLVHRQCALACCITAPFFAAPNLAPAQVGARRGSAVESRGHFLASPTWISRKWDPEGERAGEVKTHAPFSLWGAGVAVVPSSPSCSGLKGLGRRGGIEGSGSPNVRLHVREAPPQKPVPQLATRALRKG